MKHRVAHFNVRVYFHFEHMRHKVSIPAQFQYMGDLFYFIHPLVQLCFENILSLPKIIVHDLSHRLIDWGSGRLHPFTFNKCFSGDAFLEIKWHFAKIQLLLDLSNQGICPFWGVGKSYYMWNLYTIYARMRDQVSMYIKYYMLPLQCLLHEMWLSWAIHCS